MDGNDYARCSRYESLIRNAFNCERGSKNGADMQFMRNVTSMERGETFAKHLGSFEKQFDKVKNYVSKALIKLSKTNPYKKESEYFIDLEKNIKFCNYSSDLLNIIDEAMDKVVEIKNK